MIPRILKVQNKHFFLYGPYGFASPASDIHGVI